MTRTLHFNAFLMSTGHHESSWRLPESDARSGTDIRHYQRLAKIAERGTFDSIFFADSPQLMANIARRPAGNLEPLQILTAVSTVTDRIGLIATATTSYNEPFNLARAFASLDHISGGRAGWNIVTTAGLEAAQNFNLDELPKHDVRYARASEFVDVAQKLWDSWDDNAISADKESGVWGHDDRVRTVDHRGEFFSVRGPLNVPRPIQGYPLLVQAGSSEDGKDLAARYAEAVFTAQQTIEDARAFYADLKARAAAIGRNPDHIKILPGIVPVIGSTEAEAHALELELDRLIVPKYALVQLAKTLKVEPSALHLDEQLPEQLLPEDAIEEAKSRYTLIVELARRERLTVRELIGRLGGGRGHHTFTGTPQQVADAIEEWFRGEAADGFNIMPPALPSGLEVFVDEVVPILRARGLFRTEYTGSTLREHYGLPRPANQFGSVSAR